MTFRSTGLSDAAPAEQAQHGFTNRLIDSTSPYLLQHAHNPVDWHPWGSEAIEKARRENKPIFLSIGYAACHWCHVMEREVFEKQDIANIMNEHFVNIKVDREERPDLDDLYMLATQLMSGAGGWRGCTAVLRKSWSASCKPGKPCSSPAPPDSSAAASLPRSPPPVIT